jgi:hypothetical protein
VTVTTAVGAAGNVTGTNGDGIDTSAVDGPTVITNNAAVVTGGINGVSAASTGLGAITITGSGAFAGGTGNGISAVATGTGPGAGSAGITISGSGAVTTTSGGAGIFAQINDGDNASNILVTTTGSVTVGADGGYGINAETSGAGNVTVSGTGNVLAGTNGYTEGIAAYSNGGNVLAAPAGTVTATGTGIDAETIGAGTVTVTTASGAAGNVTATGFEGKTYGIYTYAVDGATTITNNAATVSGAEYGVYAKSEGLGPITITGSGAFAGGTGDGISAVETGVGPDAGSAGITISGSGAVTTTSGSGIYAHITNGSNSSNINITQSGPVTVGSGGADGIDAFSEGVGNVTVSGTGNVLAGTGSDTTGIYAYSNGGNVSITPAGTVTGSQGGIAAETYVGGTVTVTTASGAAGNVTAASGQDDGYGIYTYAVDGATTITNNAALVSGPVYGIYAQSDGAGAITVTGPGAATGGTGDGISAYAYGVGPAAGNAGITISVSGETSSTTGYGIAAVIYDSENASDILINGSGGVSVGAGGGDGVYAYTAGTGNVTITGIGAVTGGSDSEGIFAGAANGNVTVAPAGVVTGGTYGIDAEDYGAGAVTVTTVANVSGLTADGIYTAAIDGATSVTVNAGTVSGAGIGYGYAGVSEQATGAGALGLTVAAGATVTGGTTAGGVIQSQSGTGSNTITDSGLITGAGTADNPVISISATNAGSSTVTTTATGLIISTNATPNDARADLAIYSPVATGSDTIVNGGTLIGEVSLGDQANSISNSGVWDVRDNGVTSFYAAEFGTSGANSLTNSGTINAGNTLAAATTTFNDVQTITNTGTINAGLFGPADVTSFNAGEDETQTVHNSGAINVHGLLSFNGDATFNNAGGIIDMRTSGSATTDVTTLDATVGSGAASNTYAPGASAYDFVGGAGSRLGVDAYLAQVASGGATVPSDRLLISGTATGTTGILVHDTSGASGAYNPVGITVVGVNGASANAFYLAGVTGGPNDLFEPNVGPAGAIKKGFWVYPLLQTPHSVAAADGLTGASSSEYRLYGLPDSEAFQLPYAITGAQNAWYDTALGWDKRQDEIRKYWSDIYSRQSTDGSTEPGLWFKVTGDWTDRTASHSMAGYSINSYELPNVSTSFNQNTYSFQVGADTSVGSLFQANDVLVLNGFVGYVNSDLNFKSSSNSFNYSGVTVGGTLDYLNGGFFVDVLVKADLLNIGMNYNSLTSFGYDKASIDANTWGVMASAGYHITLGGGNAAGLDQTYLEPIVTIATTSSNLGNFSALGTSADFNNGDTTRGAFGARLGTVLMSGGDTFVDGSIGGRYWQEFSSNTAATVSSAGPSLVFDDNARNKGYGEVTANLTFAGQDSPWSGYVNGGAQFNSQSTTVELRGGVRYQW